MFHLVFAEVVDGIVVEVIFLYNGLYVLIPWCVFSSAVPSSSGAFQMPTRPSSSASSAAASTLRGGRANLRSASVTISLFWHESSLG